MVNPKNFFDVTVGGQPAGRGVIKLYSDVVSKTAENFRALCTGKKGVGRSGKPPHYKGQGGNFTVGNGTSGESIYSAKFADQNFLKKHADTSVLSMANADPGTDRSQFLHGEDGVA